MTWTPSPPAPAFKPPEPDAEPPAGPKTRGGRWFTVAIVGAVGLALGLGALVVLGSTPSGRRHAASPVESAMLATTSTAFSGKAADGKAWDPRVAPLAAAVERIRGLTFDTTVDVQFLSDADFDRETGDGEGTNRTTMIQELSTLRALGYTTRNPNDLTGLLNQSPEGVRGQYSPRTKRIIVRASEADVLGRAVVVHELTHALEDQHFDLAHVGDAAPNLSRYLVLPWLVEGDATYVQNRYVASLPAAEQTAYAAQQAALLAQLDPMYRGSPGILKASSFAPYSVGQWLAAVLTAHGGFPALDGAFRDLPRFSLELIDPVRYFESTDLVTVPPHVGRPGDRYLAVSPEFGAAELFSLLASRVDPRVALATADRWSGGVQTVVQRRGRVCVLVNLAASPATPPAASLRAVVDQWAHAMPPGAVTVTDGPAVPGQESVSFESCDAGRSLTAPANDAQSVMSIVVVRNALLAHELSGHRTLAQAACAADAVVQDPAFAPAVVASHAADGWAIPQPLLDDAYHRADAAREHCTG